jgi:hypothetical protein
MCLVVQADAEDYVWHIRRKNLCHDFSEVL